MPTNLKKKFAEWQKDPAYRKAYDALEGEFAQARMLLAARERSGLSQAQLAKLIGTSQPFVARLEAGRQKPTVATLEKYAIATGHRLKIELVPTKKTSRPRSTASQARQAKSA